MDFDRIDIGTLRRAGGIKWSLHPEAIGAWVAEMDFGTAPAVTAALRDAVDAGGFGYLPEALRTGRCAGRPGAGSPG